MTTNQLIEAKPGTFVNVVFKSTVKPAAAHKAHSLSKKVSGQFRAGVAYERLGAVRDAVEAGERDEVQSLPWGTWVQYPYLIEHKGTRYVRLYPKQGGKFAVQYLVDGSEVDRETFRQYLTPSEARKLDERTEPLCITVKEENLVSVG